MSITAKPIQPVYRCKVTYKSKKKKLLQKNHKIYAASTACHRRFYKSKNYSHPKYMWLTRVGTNSVVWVSSQQTFVMNATCLAHGGLLAECMEVDACSSANSLLQVESWRSVASLSECCRSKEKKFLKSSRLVYQAVFSCTFSKRPCTASDGFSVGLLLLLLQR